MIIRPKNGVIDRAALWADASEDVVRACALAAYGEPNKALSNGAELRFGAHGSKAVCVRGEKRGSWYDHEAQTGGFLLIPDADFKPCATPTDGRFYLNGGKPDAKRDTGNGGAAKAIWAAPVPIPGTPAEVYLGGRGITHHIPDTVVRYHPSAVDGLPCCVYAVTDREGAVVAIQRVALLPDGSDRDRKAGKKSLGPVGAGSFTLADPRPLQTIICEGPEDALAIWFAAHEDIGAPDARVIAMCGQRWASAAEAHPGAIFVPDADSITRATEAAASCDGWIASPAPHKDANEFIIARGRIGAMANVFAIRRRQKPHPRQPALNSSASPISRSDPCRRENGWCRTWCRRGR